MQVPSLETMQKYATAPLAVLDNRHAARSGLAVGAVVVALSAASAGVTALRERSKRS